MDHASNAVAFQLLPIEALKPYSPVLRRHPSSQLAIVRKSLAHYGQVVPILVSAGYEIIDGHLICEALKANGESKVLVGIVNHLTPTQVRGLRLQLNRAALDAVWDQHQLRVEFEELIDLSFDLELTGFAAHEINFSLDFEIRSKKASKLERAVPPLGERPVSRRGDIYELGPHRLGCGDGRDRAFVACVLGSAKPAACFLDDSCFGENGCALLDANSFDLFRDSLEVLKQVSRPGTIICAFTDWRRILALTAAGHHLGLPLVDVCVWAHNKAGIASLYRNQHQLVGVFAVDGLSQHRPLGRSNVWKYAAASDPGESSKPIKPVTLFSDAVCDLTRRGDTVLDSFGGSGSVIIAAEQTGRHCRAIENDPRYVDRAIRRWQTLTGADAVLSENGEPFKDRGHTRSPRLELGHGR
jgi:hypothetical protein